MKIDSLLEAPNNGLQPTDFDLVKSNANRVFGDALGFYIVEKNNSTNRSDTYIYDEFEIAPEELKSRLFNKFLKDYNLKKSEVKIVDVHAQAPDLNPDGTVNPAELPTYSQRVANTRGDYTDSKGKLVPQKLLELGVITADNVKQVLAQHPSHSINEKYTNALIDRLLTPGTWKPAVILKNAAEFEHATKIKTGKYLSDFGEIAGAVGLVCSSINGNGVRMLPYFFAAGGSIPSKEEIKKEATIHFHPSKTHSLVDSYIDFRGQIVRVSSKAAGGELSGGSGATFAGIFQSIAEISRSKEGVDAFNKLLRKRPQAAQALRKLKILANVASEDDATEMTWLAKVELLRELLTNSEQNVYNIAVTDSDLQILKTLWAASGENLSDMHKFKYVFGRALGSEVDARLDDGSVKVGEFSTGFKNIMRSFNLNKFGEAGGSGAENPKQTDAYNSTRGWWLRFQKALVFAIANIVNRDPDFSFLCTWILNHGSFIQIDLRSSTNSKTEQVVITNISATWPSTAVDKVILVPLAKSSGFSYKLLINSDRDWPQIASQFNDPELEKVYQDDDFGFKDAATRDKLKDATKIGKYDLLRFNRQWEELLGKSGYANFPDSGKSAGKTRNSSTNAQLTINGMFTSLAGANIISSAWKSQPAAVVTDLVAKILKGELDEQHLTYVDRNVEYALQNFHTLSTDSNEFVNESLREDEDDEEEDIPGVKTVQVSPADRAKAVKELQTAQALIRPLYIALQIDNALRSGNRAEVGELEAELTTALGKLKKNTRPLDVNALIKARNTNLDPRNRYRDFVPPGFNKEKADRQRGTTAAIARMKQFLSEFQLVSKVKGTGRRGEPAQYEYKSLVPSFPAIGNFVTGIISGLYDNEVNNIFTEFKTLLQDPNVVEIIKHITLQTVNHPEEIGATLDEDDENVSSNFTSDREVATAIAFIYWSLLIKSYIDRGQTSTPQFKEVVANSARLAKYVYTDSGNYSSYLSSIKSHLADVDNHSVPKIVIQVFSKIYNKATSGVPGFKASWNKLDHANREAVKDQVFDYMTSNINITSAADNIANIKERTAITQVLVQSVQQHLASQETQ
jgi:hypothetical protein